MHHVEFNEPLVSHAVEKPCHSDQAGQMPNPMERVDEMPRVRVMHEWHWIQLLYDDCASAY
jgi:hypothetical protein